jgi:hypothetical protein
MLIGRFASWLLDNGNLEAYLQLLLSTFNPASVAGFMCRNTLSIGVARYTIATSISNLECSGRTRHLSSFGISMPSDSMAGRSPWEITVLAAPPDMVANAVERWCRPPSKESVRAEEPLLVITSPGG